MTWTGQSFTLNQILTSTQMNNLQADITAQANGDSGAPKQQTAGIEDSAVTTAKINDGDVTTAKLDQTSSSEAVTTACVRDNAITQPKISTSEETDSTTSLAEILVLSAGSWTLGITAARTSGTNQSNAYTANIGMATNTDSVALTISGSHTSYISLGDSGATITLETKCRYIVASPPYDLGDGEVPIFVWAKVDSLGNVISIQSSVTPPWAYNGPTNITPDRYENTGGLERKFKSIRQVDENTGEIIIVEREIDMTMKNADMGLIPHPFASMQAGEQVILLDPPDTLYLKELMQAGESINELLHNDYLRLDNTPINRSVPNGVTPSRFRWKNTTRRAGEAVEDRRLQRGPYENANINSNPGGNPNG